MPRTVIEAAEAPVFSRVLGRQVVLKAKEEVPERFSGFKVELTEAKGFSSSGERFGGERPGAFKSGGG